MLLFEMFNAAHSEEQKIYGAKLPKTGALRRFVRDILSVLSLVSWNVRKRTKD